MFRGEKQGKEAGRRVESEEAPGRVGGGLLAWAWRLGSSGCEVRLGLQRGGPAIRGWRYESGAVKAGRMSGLRIGRVWGRGESRVLSK